MGSGALRVCVAWTPEPGSRGRSRLEAASHVASSRWGDHGPPEAGGGARGPPSRENVALGPWDHLGERTVRAALPAL